MTPFYSVFSTSSMLLLSQIFPNFSNRPSLSPAKFLLQEDSGQDPAERAPREHPGTVTVFLIIFTFVIVI